MFLQQCFEMKLVAQRADEFAKMDHCFHNLQTSWAHDGGFTLPVTVKERTSKIVLTSCFKFLVPLGHVIVVKTTGPATQFI